MATSDPIADMLTRIRNAVRSRMPHVNVKRSKVCTGIARVLKEEGYITDFAEVDDNSQGEIRVYLKYTDHGSAVVSGLRRESKPSMRVYRGTKELPRVLDGLGIAVVSTSRGVLSDRQARKMKVGGELLCTVW